MRDVHLPTKGRSWPWVAALFLVVLAGWYLSGKVTPSDDAPPAPPPLADGEHLGFIRALRGGGTAMDLDDAVWLTGKEGEDAAIAAGHCTEASRHECLPNGYFILNAVSGTARLAVDPAATVVMQTWRMEETGEVAERELELRVLAELINDPTLHWRTLPYRVFVSNGTVVRIREVYVP